MSQFVANTASVAMYALAALPFIALSTAHAETVKISDLRLSQPAQVEMLDARIDRAARRLCAERTDPRDLNRSAACVHAVRAEAMDKLAQAERQPAGAVSLASR